MVNQSSRTRNPRTKANGQGTIYFIEERNKWGAAYFEECSDSLVMISCTVLDLSFLNSVRASPLIRVPPIS